MATEKQRQQRARFKTAAAQAKREGKKGKTYARRVGELLRGGSGASGKSSATSRASSRATRPSGGSSSTGGRSMAKNKVKPRLAIWVGAAGSAVVAAGEVSGGPIPRNIREDIKG